jgi:hypothetical protein
VRTKNGTKNDLLLALRQRETGETPPRPGNGARRKLACRVEVNLQLDHAQTKIEKRRKIQQVSSHISPRRIVFVYFPHSPYVMGTQKKKKTTNNNKEKMLRRERLRPRDSESIEVKREKNLFPPRSLCKQRNGGYFS